MLLNIVMLSLDLSQNGFRVKFVQSIEPKTKFVVLVALESIIYKKKQNKAKQKSKLGHQEFIRIVKTLKNIISEHNMLEFCQKYSEIIVRTRRLVVSDFLSA